ncbi:glutathione synthase [Streptomyces sp. IBSBF 2507]|uniref:glutathione synthase n=1 Tax=Streptomyces sp. IBSBF 2507 TaxID=2903530 RepID=UPI00351E6A50
MRFLFVIDPLPGLRPEHDTSVALMEAAQRAGVDVWAAEAAELVLGGGGAAAWARPVRINPAERRAGRWKAPATWWRGGAPERIRLRSDTAVLMRVDPPVNSAYLRATYILDAAVREGALVVNNPRGLRDANEKLLPLTVDAPAPDTIITARSHDILEALERWDVAVAKPLEGAGGRGVVMVRRSDPGLAALIGLVTSQGTRQTVLQEYLPAVAEGDKRIFLLDGEPVGAINRRASDQDFRCNLAVGAVAEATVLDESDAEICRRLHPRLELLGLPLVGIDVIGGRLTEVNVTSPTGLREIELLTDDRPSDRIVEWITNAATASGSATLGG